MSLKLYGYWRSSCSYRVRIALRLKGIAYDDVPVHLLKGGGPNGAGEQHAEDFRQLSPLAQVPVLQLADGRVISQSMAILEYLEERYPTVALLPKDPYLRAKTRQLAEMVNAGIQPLQNLAVTQYVDANLQGGGKIWAQHFISKGLAALNVAAESTQGTYLVGDSPTLADVCLVPQLFGALRMGVDIAQYPILERINRQCTQLEPFVLAHPSNQSDAE